MNSSVPHYLLFSESHLPDSQDASPRGRWRFVLEAIDGSSKLEVEEKELHISGERLELLAVVRGLEALDQPSRVTLVTPSRYVCRGFRHGLEEWRETGWQWERFGQMAPIKNCDLWQRIDKALEFHQVECRTWRFDQQHEMSTPQEELQQVDANETGQASTEQSPNSSPWLQKFAVAVRRFMVSESIPDRPHGPRPSALFTKHQQNNRISDQQEHRSKTGTGTSLTNTVG